MSEKTNIVLIHGFPLDASMWDGQRDALKAAGYNVLTPNLPGFGGTAAWESSKYSIEALAEEMYEYMMREAGGSAVVGGFSMGGYVLLALLREHPEVVRGAVLIDTRAGQDTPEGKAARLKMIEEVKNRGSVAAAEAMIDRLLYKDASKGLREKVMALMTRQKAEAIVGAQLAMSRRHDQTELLPELTIPMQVMVGAFDIITPPSVAMEMHNHMRFSTLAQIARTGHLANMEAPAAFNSALVSFLQTLERRTAAAA